MWPVTENTDCLFFPRTLLLATPRDGFPWWIEFLSVLRGGRGCVHSPGFLTATNSQLFLAGSLDLIDPAWCCRAPETTAVSSRTSGLNKVISVQHISKCHGKCMSRWRNSLVWADGGIHLFHFPLVNLSNPFACGMFVFHTFNFLLPRYKIQYLKVGSGKVNQVALTLIPQICLFVHVEYFLFFNYCS